MRTPVLVLIAAFAFVSGCAVTPHYDDRFGDAVRSARAATTIDPAAGANKDPAAGLDGKASRETMILYQGTFKAPPTQTGTVINIGK